VHEDVLRSATTKEVHDDVEDLRVKDRGCLEIFARSGCARQNENAGTDDCANAQRSQRPGPKSFFQPMLGFFRFGDQFVDGFSRE
jgi:hypothetical protein